VAELERAGVAALTLEDTLLPPKYGHKTTDLIPLDEAVGKIRAALEAAGGAEGWRDAISAL